MIVIGATTLPSAVFVSLMFRIEFRRGNGSRRLFVVAENQDRAFLLAVIDGEFGMVTAKIEHNAAVRPGAVRMFGRRAARSVPFAVSACRLSCRSTWSSPTSSGQRPAKLAVINFKYFIELLLSQKKKQNNQFHNSHFSQQISFRTFAAGPTARRPCR